MKTITLAEVDVAAHNAAFIANCSCPARYRGTEWEQTWRDLRAHYLKELLAKPKEDEAAVDAGHDGA